MSHPTWFSSLFEELRIRNSRAHASLLSPAALPLRNWLEQTLGADPGDPDGLLSTPVFEHKFGFETVDQTMGDLVRQGLISEALCDCMSNPPKELRDQAFPRNRHPYTHQVAAWQTLKQSEPMSVVVSAGTGAGKTECFLVPILDDLARQSQNRQGDLEGVQALFLYPLNALINSQRERLSAWTRGFNGRIRYCLYNGETKRREKASEQRKQPERVLSRKLLRESPPPLLITNATMLEYMLVRPDDAPILEKSKGKLKYIVIDEAHTYVGSMAAELALLLRRVMNAFDVDPADVRFIATSATLSSGEGEDAVSEIRKFLADIAGQPQPRVRVLTDTRAIPQLPKSPVKGGLPVLDELAGMEPAARFESLCMHRGSAALRQILVERGARTVRELRKTLEDEEGLVLPENDLIQLLDLCTTAVPEPRNGDSESEAFLPLRGHIFGRGIEGLWACLNPRCPGRASLGLESGAWPFGSVFSTHRTHCSHADCGAPVFELALCQQCGTEALVAKLVEDDGFELAVPLAFDELSAPSSETEDIEQDDDLDQDEDTKARNDPGQARLLCQAHPEVAGSDELGPVVRIEATTGSIDPQQGGTAFSLVRTGEDGRMHCPHCGHGDRSDRRFFRNCRTGCNFVLGVSVPVLLEHMPPANENADELPLHGKRTISFTDSRQGTARFAARSQGESERNYVRSFIYHQVISEQGTDPARVAALEKEVESLTTLQAEVVAKGIDGSLLDGQIAQKQAELDAERGAKAVRVTDVAQRLAATSSFKHLHTYWKDYLPFKESGIDRGTLAKWLVMREFARRPMRRASLETLGLLSVQFPKLDLERSPPRQWQAWAKGDAEASWHDFLKLILDFYIRSNSAVELDNAFFRWVGTTIRQKTVNPREKPIRNRRISWPRFAQRTRPRLAWLVVRAFGLDHTDPSTRERVNDVLDEAWSSIRPALKPAEDGHQLVMDQMLLKPVEQAWVCPLTRMLLDTTLLGHTPYQPPLDRVFDTRGRRVRVPRAPDPFWLSDDPEKWLESDPVVSEARKAGALSEFAERVLCHTRYYQVAEHSAQLQTSALKKAERQFRKGRLNLLSCSTTMEMGVDIGNLSGVAMNNAPPSPANFLQRVGRAGRRGENAAVSLTVCRHLPHDQAVFAEPDWPFRTPMHITPVKLDSHRIVERHVRAAALTRFLQNVVPEQTILTLNCAWFFLPGEDQERAVCDRLIAWLLEGATRDETLKVHLTRLVRESALHGVPVRTLLADCVPAFSGAKERFEGVRLGIMAQIEELPEEDRGESPAWYALDRQRRRLDQEYLLSVLADQQVLPGYGFPTGVVPLVTTTVEELKALKRADERANSEAPEPAAAREERVDARTRLMGFPTRDLPMAIREYAPGGNVVLERRTYMPRGVTLNWHLRPNASSDNVRDVQALREAWLCPMCGATGTESGSAPRSCPSCAHPKLRRSRYLEPAGFAVDLFEDAQMDAAPATFIPLEEPWISSGTGSFESIGRPALVRFRHAHDGEVVYLNSGLHGHGYALCLRCGRAEPETESGTGGPDLPKRMEDHLRLRGGKGSNWKNDSPGARCEGNESSWAIQRNLKLGGSTRTDVLEIHLLDPDSGQLVSDRTLLTTIAVALRKEAARALGIDERELGYQVARRIEQGSVGAAILLYDTAAGGAGFSAEIPPLLPKLLGRAVATCRCPRGCDRACHSCLLSNDTQHDLDYIDRFLLAPADGGQATLLNDQFLRSMELPDAYRVFGSDTKTLWGNPHLGLLQHARRLVGVASGVTVQLRVYSDGHGWDPVAWPARRLVRALHELGEVKVRLLVPEESLRDLDWQQRRQLAGLAENEALEIHMVGGDTSGKLRIWAEISGKDGVTAFASDEALAFNHAWATRDGDALHVYGDTAALTTPGEIVRPADLVAPLTGGVVELDLRPSAYGRARDFGKRFWAVVEDSASGLMGEMKGRGPADRLVYQDRYLKSPQAVQALFQVVSHLHSEGVVGRETSVEVFALQASSERSPGKLGQNWARWEDQRDVMEGLFASLGCKLQVHLTPDYDRKKTQHHRSLEIAWGAKEVELRLDSGFGFLHPVPDDRFPFAVGIDGQVSKLLKGSWRVDGPFGRGPVPGYLIR